MNHSKPIVYQIVVFVFALYSCEGKPPALKEFVQNGELVLYLDQFTSPVEEYIQYLPDWRGREVMAFHVRKKSEIKLYDLKSGELTESLKYAYEGPKSFPNIYDFHIHDEDHIFLNRRYHYKTHWVNKDFELKKTYEFLEPGTKFDPNSGIPLSPNTFLPIFTHNRIFRKFQDSFILTGSPDINADSPKRYDVDCMLVKVDMESGEISRLLGYPEKMRGKAWGTFHSLLYTDYGFENKLFVLSYAADEEVYVANGNLEIVSSFSANPDNFQTIKSLPNAVVNNDQAYLVYYNNEYIFGSILFDEFRGIIYRIALEPNPKYGDVYIRDPLYKPRNMVVMAFDPKASYEKIAEVRLVQSDQGVYLDRCFVNEKGLNIAYVDMGNEDRLYFKTFIVK